MRLSRESQLASRAGAATESVEEAAGHVVEGVKDTAQALVKPRARGWIHLVFAVLALFAGASLISVSWPLAGLKAGLATFV